MLKIIKTANNYIRACINGKLINGIKKSSEKPKITTLTACYNSEKTIKRAIRSIQNQIMPDIEILIINRIHQLDFSYILSLFHLYY